MENLVSVLKSLLLDSGLMVASIVGVIVVYGLIFGIQEEVSRKNLFSSLGHLGIIITAPGVVIHELSHYLMCKVFGYKVREVKLFRPIASKTDGCLGYVKHVHNPKNVIQNIGMFFVGTAPILGGAATLLVLLRILLPEVFYELVGQASRIPNLGEINIHDFISLQFNMILDTMKLLFTSDNVRNVSFWIFLYLAVCISSHIGLSGADLKGSVSGLIALFLTIFAAGSVLFIFGINITTYIDKLAMYNLVLSIALSMALCLALIHLLFSYIVKIIFKTIR